MYPLRILFDSDEEISVPAVMAVSVPKRLFKHAVDRNLLKRRIREAYRLHKPELFASLGKAGIHCQMVIQFRGREIESYHSIEEKLQDALKKLINRLSEEISE